MDPFYPRAPDAAAVPPAMPSCLRRAHWFAAGRFSPRPRGLRKLRPRRSGLDCTAGVFTRDYASVWIGENVLVGPRAIVGPAAIVENGGPGRDAEIADALWT